MMRNRSLRTAVLLSVSLWTVASICYVTPAAVDGAVSARYLHFLAVCASCGITLTVLLSLPVVRGGVLEAPLRRALWAAGVAGAVLVHAGVDTAVYIAMYKPQLLANPHALLGPRLAIFVTNVLLLGAVYVIYATGLALSLSSEALRLRERRLAEALALAQEAQLAALRLQINPHFLFNALNAATALVGSGRNAEAEMVIGRLADFFRASLEAPVGQLAPIEAEFDVVTSYLHIEAARFGDRLQVEVDLPPELAGALAPHFLLQPLVENAIKHGVARSRTPVQVRVSAAVREAVLTLSVEDDAPDGAAGVRPDEEAGLGLGLANVRQRLAAHFGDRAELRTARLHPGFRAEVRMPLAYAEPQLRAAE